MKRTTKLCSELQKGVAYSTKLALYNLELLTHTFITWGAEMETAVIVLSDILMVIVIGGGFSIHHYMVKHYSKIIEQTVPGATEWYDLYHYGFGSMLSDMFGSVKV